MLIQDVNFPKVTRKGLDSTFSKSFYGPSFLDIYDPGPVSPSTKTQRVYRVLGFLFDSCSRFFKTLSDFYKEKTKPYTLSCNHPEHSTDDRYVILPTETLPGYLALEPKEFEHPCPSCRKKARFSIPLSGEFI